MSMSDERKTQDQTPASRPADAGSNSGAPAEATDDGIAKADRAEPKTQASQAPSAGASARVESAESSSAESSSAEASGAEPSNVGSRPTVQRTVSSETPPSETQSKPVAGVYFFPDRVVSEAEVRRMLASDSAEDQAEAVSRLLTYAEYDEIWTWVDRDTVRELFEQLDLPDRLRAAWARNLGLVAKTS